MSNRGRVAVLMLLLAVLVSGWLVAATPSSSAADGHSTTGTTTETTAQRPRKLNTSSWLSVNAVNRIAGEMVELSGHVYPEMSRRVVIQHRIGTTWRKLEAGRTNSHGAFPLRFKAGTKDVDYRLVVPRHRRGSSVYKASRSRVLTITSVEQEVKLTMKASGDTIEAHVWAVPFRKGRPVKIQVHGDSTWRTLAEGRLDKNGLENFTFLRAGSGLYTFRAVVREWHGAPKVASQPQGLAITASRDKTPPAAPDTLKAKPGDASVELTWTKSSSKDVAGYLIYMRPSGADTWSTTLLHENAGYFRITHLENKTTYQFMVSAVDEAGNESGHTSTVSATPKAEVNPTEDPGGSGSGTGDPGTGTGDPGTGDPNTGTGSGSGSGSGSGPGKPGHDLGEWEQLWVTWFPWLPLLPFWP